ncbi:MAG: epmA [Planctomycetaceae bacterium]|nr:epmA [Planctomycetaceae bacterium]
MTLDFLPTADIETLRFRAGVLAAIRQFFDQRDHFEVDTPLLSQDRVIDSNIEPFVIPQAVGGQDLFLQTSPEFAMKRLLVAGAKAIYQLDKVFRRDERGQRHNPEFTMLEWYAVGTDHQQQMQFTEELVRRVFELSPVRQLPTAPFRRSSYQEAFQRQLGIDVFKLDGAALSEVARQHAVNVPESQAADDRDGWLNLLLAELIEPLLGRDVPEFLYDYPSSQAALARVRPGPPAVAERFELYLDGIELCNGYHELADPEELRERIRQTWTTREGDPPVSSRLLQAMESGLPPCSGVALGVDRLVMLAAGKTRLDEVIAFPIERC